jgi:hypothetical protein
LRARVAALRASSREFPAVFFDGVAAGMSSLRGNNLVTAEAAPHADASRAGPIVKQLLLAEPNAATAHVIAGEYADRAHVIACRDFQSARASLLARAPDVLVTNLRLVDYNGLHLVLLARAMHNATICIVHTDRPDTVLVREAQASGAFFERTERLPLALGGYLISWLPDRDRRTPDRVERRLAFRGGRRAADQSMVL